MMSASALARREDAAPERGERLAVMHQLLDVDTTRPVEFLDVTTLIATAVRDAGLEAGTVIVHTRHTTTGILVNEHEPLLFEDLRRTFEDIAPAGGYAHDDFSRRTVNLVPDERRNGHAHCRAALLRSSEAVPVCNGKLELGRWQRLFLVEFDGAQRRQLMLTLMGTWR